MGENREDNGITLEEFLKRQKNSGIEAAIRDGNAYKERLLMGTDMLTPIEIVGKLHIQPELLEKMADDRKLLRLDAPSGNRRYPLFQFEDGVLPMIERLFAAMPDYDHWGLYLFLNQPDGNLYPGTPLDWIRNGKEDQVLWLAKVRSEE